MKSSWLAGPVLQLAILLSFSMLLPTAAFASVTPYPAYPGAPESLAYRVTVDGQPVFVHRLPTPASP